MASDRKGEVAIGIEEVVSQEVDVTGDHFFVNESVESEMIKLFEFPDCFCRLWFFGAFEFELLEMICGCKSTLGISKAWGNCVVLDEEVDQVGGQEWGEVGSKLDVFDA